MAILKISPEPVIELLLRKRYYAFAETVNALVEFCYFKQESETALRQLDHDGAVFKLVKKLIDVAEF